MTLRRRLLRVLDGRRRSRDVTRDVDDELTFHIEQHTRELLSRGVPPEHAWDMAYHAFGNLEYTRRYCRRQGVLKEGSMFLARLVRDTAYDIRYAIKLLRTAPGFSVVCVLTLALGIGANTAIFTVVNAVLWRQLPYQAPHELHVVHETLNDIRGIAAGTYTALRNRSDLPVELVLYSAAARFNMTQAGGEPADIRGALVSAAFFRMLGHDRAMLGRTLRPQDDQPGAEPVVILAHGTWQQVFGADTGVVGTIVNLDGRPYTVAGVMPSDFLPFPRGTNLWIPRILTDADQQTPALSWNVLARIGGGATADQLAGEGRRIQQELRSERSGWRTDARWSVTVTPLHASLVGAVEPALLAMAGAVGFVLLLACANLTNLILSRDAGRRHELALRIALGADQGRLSRQLLTESSVVALLGGIAGVAVAWFGTRGLLAAGPPDLPRLDQVGIDASVLGFAAAITVLTGLVIGVAPAIITARRAPQQGLGSESRGGHRAGQASRRLLVGLQAALVIVLLMGAGLLGRSLQEKLALDPGVPIDGRWVVQLSLPASKYASQPQIDRVVADMRSSVARIPGVLEVASTTTRPLGGSLWNSLYIPGEEAEETPITDFEAVSPEFFGALGIPILQGRTFTESELQRAADVAVVNVALVRRHFADESPIGREIGFDADGARFRIVGVAADVRAELEPSVASHVYLPNFQIGLPWRTGWRYLVLRVAQGTEVTELPTRVRDAIWDIDGDQAVAEIAALGDIRSDLVQPARFNAVLMIVFAAAGLLLGLAGIYGVVSYSVSGRIREVGIRLALGSAPWDVTNLLIRREVPPVLAGVALGIVASIAVTRALDTLLFGVSPFDLLTYLTIPLLLICVAVATIWIPSHRATRLDPVRTLRGE